MGDKTCDRGSRCRAWILGRSGFVALVVCAPACIYPGDGPPPDYPRGLDVVRWTVTDQVGMTVLSSGCMVRFGNDPGGGASAIKVRAGVGQRIVYTLRGEFVFKQHTQAAEDRAQNSDALWCSTDDDASRTPAIVTLNPDCWRPGDNAPVKVLSQEVLPAARAVDSDPRAPLFIPGEGRQLTLEVTGSGPFWVLPTGLCKTVEHTELEIVPP